MSKDKNKREQKQEATEAQGPTAAGADLSKETETLSRDQHEAVVAAPSDPTQPTEEVAAVDDDRLTVTEQFPVKGRETITGVAQPDTNNVARAMAAKNRESCIKALKALVGAKLGDRLEGPLREVISDLTEGTVNAAIKNRLEIIAAVCHDDAVRKALEALA